MKQLMIIILGKYDYRPITRVEEAPRSAILLPVFSSRQSRTSGDFLLGKEAFPQKIIPTRHRVGETWDSSTRDPWKMDYMGYGRHGRKTGETRISLNSHLLNDIEYCRLNHIVQRVLVTGKGSFAPNLKKVAAIA